jgi:hypothetical protein
MVGQEEGPADHDHGLTFSTFRSIFDRVLEEFHGTVTDERVAGDSKILGVSLPGCMQPLQINLERLHHKYGCAFSPSEKTCCMNLREYLRVLTSPAYGIPSTCPNSNVFLTVKTRSFVTEFEISGDALLLPADPEVRNLKPKPKVVVSRNFSEGSQELVTAIVVDVNRNHDLYVSDDILQLWDMSESRSFEIAVQNIDRITPVPMKCNICDIEPGMKQYKALKTRVEDNPYEVCCIRNCDRKPLFRHDGI